MSVRQYYLPGVNQVLDAAPPFQATADPEPPSPKKEGQRKPPSPRDLRMYDRVVIEDVSQYVVAEEEGLTQGYVSKRVRRVIEWMGRVGNKEYGVAAGDEKLRYLHRFAEKKYDYYRRESEAAFRESRRDLVIIKERGTRQASAEQDEKNVGQFVGEVKIEKTIRPREGNPRLLREARQGMDNLVLLACHVIARQEVPLPPEPDAEAARNEKESIARQLHENLILAAAIGCRNQEIMSLKADLAAAQRELNAAPFQASHENPAAETLEERSDAFVETVQPAPHEGEASTGTDAPRPSSERPSSESGSEAPQRAEKGERPVRRLILESHNGACVPLKESELLKLEKEGLTWLAEVGDLIASLEPVNGYDMAYRNQLVELYRNCDRNYRQHNVIPERQKLPRPEAVRRGLPYGISIPLDRDKFSPT